MRVQSSSGRFNSNTGGGKKVLTYKRKKWKGRKKVSTIGIEEWPSGGERKVSYVRVGLNFLPTIVGAHSDCSLGGPKSAAWVVLQSDHSDCNLPFSFLTNRSPPLIIFAPPHPTPKNPLARAPRSAEIAPAPPSLLSSF